MHTPAHCDLRPAHWHREHRAVKAQNGNLPASGRAQSAWIIMVCACLGSRISAQEPLISDTGMAVRINVIQAALDKDETWSKVWFSGWLGVSGIVVVVSAAKAVATDNQGDRIVDIVSGIEGLISATTMVSPPFPSAFASRTLRRMSSNTSDELAAKLSSAENLLAHAAKSQAFGRSWINQVLNLGLNGAGALVIWQGFDDQLRRADRNPGREALVFFIEGMIFSELSIFSEPNRCIKALKRYRRDYASPAQNNPGTINLYLAPTKGGLGLKLVSTF
jgi:hypothetical protein